MPHGIILLIILLLSVFAYTIYIKNNRLVPPETFMSFENNYNRLVNNIVKPNNFSRFKYFNEFKI